MMTALVSTWITSPLKIHINQPEYKINVTLELLLKFIIPTHIITQTVNSKHSKVKMMPKRTIRQLIFVKNSAVMIMVSESSVSLRISCIIMLFVVC